MDSAILAYGMPGVSSARVSRKIVDFKQLRSFVSVVRYGSFTVAAAKLNVSQPTVSLHLRSLEEELGQPLLVRSAKRVRLTESGAKVYEQCLAILSMHDRLISTVSNRDGNVIYLGASSVPAAYILPQAMSSFKSDNDDVHFSIHQASSQDIVDGVSDGGFDVGFVGVQVKNDAINCVPFYRDRLVLITPNCTPYQDLDMSRPLDVAPILASSEVILREVGSGTRAEVERVLGEAGIDSSDLNVIASLNDMTTVNNLVEHNFGVGFASLCSVKDRVEQGKLLAFDIAGANTERFFYILRRVNASDNPTITRFVTFMRLQFAKELGE